MPIKFTAFLGLCRISNLPTVFGNCVAAWILGGGEFKLTLVLLLIGAAFVYSSGMVMNDAVDVEFDKEFRPERPIPSGVISKRSAWIIACSFMFVGVVMLLIGGGSYYWTMMLSVAVVWYNLTHKRWAGSIYVMGACRCFLYLVAASAGGEWFCGEVLIWGAGLGLYTAGITVAAKGEARDADVRFFGIALLLSPLVAALLINFIYDVDYQVQFILCVALWLMWTIYCVLILRKGGEGRVGKAVSFFIAGMLLIDGAVVADVCGWGGALFAPFLLLVLAFQRKIAGT